MTFRQLKYSLFLSFLLLLCVLTWGYLGKKEAVNPMIGTWEMKSGVYMAPDGTTNIAATDSRQMKIINETHFTTLWQDIQNNNENVGFNGGYYTYDNNIYSEYLQYFSITGRIGDTAHFKVEVQGDDLSISACDKEGNISKTGYFQVWQRVR